MSEKFFAHFAVIFAIVLALNYTLNCLSYITSVIGSAVIILIITWQLTGRIYRHINNNKPISSHKKAVLVTGCDTGFGNHLAFKLNKQGFMVYATVLNTQNDGSMKLMSECVFPDLMKVLPMDVTSDEDVRKTYEFVRNDLQRIDHQLWGLVNNAGVMTMGLIEFGNLDTYQKLFAVNVIGLVRVTRTFLPLIRHSKGRIVNVSSLCGKVTAPLTTYYSMTKHAVNSFSDALRREMRKFGVKVSIVMPCSPFSTNMLTDSYVSQIYDNIMATTDDSVKQFYGPETIDNIMKFVQEMTTPTKVCTNLDLVIDPIIDGLVSNSSKISYSISADRTSYIANLFLEYMPNEILDSLMVYLIKKI